MAFIEYDGLEDPFLLNFVLEINLNHRAMKKYIVIFLLIAGLSEISFAQQKYTFKQNGFERVTKKKHQRKQQVTHFEKNRKDKRLATNGTSYKNVKKHKKVDVKSFASANGVRNDKKFVSASRAQKKQYKSQLRESVYAKNTGGGSLRRQMLYGR